MQEEQRAHDLKMQQETTKQQQMMWEALGSALGKSAPRDAPAKMSPRSVRAQLKELKELHDDGLITDDEYASKKAALLAGM